MITKRVLLRSGGGILITALSIYLFYIGKGHTIIIDNSTVQHAGVEIKSVEMAGVSIDGAKAEEIGRAERIMVQTSGPSHRVTVEIIAGKEQGKKISQRFKIPTAWSTVLLSVPMVLSGLPDSAWCTVFVAPEQQAAEAEKTIQQEDSDVLPAQSADSSAQSQPGKK
ncbi:MAG: hypothetical protein JW795_02270 [Chitinivibrionales bacterium]|nr:hypothetical protein [Chitinivibrionales bacterium]